MNIPGLFPIFLKWILAVWEGKNSMSEELFSHSDAHKGTALVKDPGLHVWIGYNLLSDLG